MMSLKGRWIMLQLARANPGENAQILFVSEHANNSLRELESKLLLHMQQYIHCQTAHLGEK